MGRSKAKTLYWVWKKYSGSRGKEKLREVGVVSEEDVNGFLRLVGEREEEIHAYKLGWFVSEVLGVCYAGRFIKLDVDAVDGEIAIGYELDWDGVIYVKGDVNCSIGTRMEQGVVIVEGDVVEDVGNSMRGGVMIVEGNVKGYVGAYMEKGTIIVEGDVNGFVAAGMKGGEIVVKGDVGGNVGASMKRGFIIVEGDIGGCVGFGVEGGVIVVNGDIEYNEWLAMLWEGFVVVNGFVYTGRWSE